jgi:hypothetical protein
LMDRLLTPIKQAHSVSTSWAPHESPWVLEEMFADRDSSPHSHVPAKASVPYKRASFSGPVVH